MTNKFKYEIRGDGIKSTIGFGSDSLNELLRNRGIKNPQEFLNVNESHIEDYHLFDNLQYGIMCYKNHIGLETKKALIVDFDADGYTSASVFYMYSKKLCFELNKQLNMDIIIHEKKNMDLQMML